MSNEWCEKGFTYWIIYGVCRQRFSENVMGEQMGNSATARCQRMNVGHVRRELQICVCRIFSKEL